MGIGELLVVVLLDKVGTDGFSNVQVRGVGDNVLKFRRETHVIEGRAPSPGTDEVMIGKGILTERLLAAQLPIESANTETETS